MVMAIYDKQLLRGGIVMLVQYFFPKNPNPIFSVLRHASTVSSILQPRLTDVGTVLQSPRGIQARLAR